MINELLQERAALYVAGVMTVREREDFELIMEFHEEVRHFVAESQEVATAILLASVPADAPAPPARLKLSILGTIADQAQQVTGEGFVMTGPDRLVQWVNPAFTEMCGYSLEELRGKSLGPILQGEKTDPVVAGRMREAVHEFKPCHEQLVNYRKDGTPYRVDIEIRPILDEAGVPLWMVARERELSLAA